MACTYQSSYKQFIIKHTMFIILLFLASHHISFLSLIRLFNLFFGRAKHTGMGVLILYGAFRDNIVYHKFRRVSKRGRAAYLILCLEKCLSFYGENIGDWKWILEELWEITSTRDIERWGKRVCDLTSESVLPFVSYQEMIEKVKANGYWYELSEETFTSLQSLYRKERTGFQTISGLIDRIYGVIVDDWRDSEEPFTLSCLHNIDEAEETMRHNNIPLPSDGSAIDFIMSHRDKHYGKPFQGVQFSAIRKMRSNSP